MIEPIGKHFGIHWQVEATLDPEPFGEFTFIGSDFSPNGGTYWIIHDWEIGDFELQEAGGRGPHVWEHTIGLYHTPLEAMRAARQYDNEQAAIAEAEWAQMKEWERWDARFEEERQLDYLEDRR